jgi:hypothetical protein
MPALRQDSRIPPAFQCPQSGFHGFQCWHPSRVPIRWGAAGSRTSGSSAMVVQKVLRHFRGCGILPRRCAREASGRAGAPVPPVPPFPFLFPFVSHSLERGKMPHPPKGGAQGEREITENIGVFACFPPPIRPWAGRPRLLPPAFQCPRSGFHCFQCWHPSRIPVIQVREAAFETFL